MKYMLMMNTPKGGEYQVMSWPKKDLEAHIAFMMEFARNSTPPASSCGAEGLASPSQAKLVRAGKDGKPITDGVFPESKEFLAGYWIVDVDNSGACVPDRRRSVRRARRRRRAAESADRSARGHERTAATGLTGC